MGKVSKACMSLALGLCIFSFSFTEKSKGQSGPTTVLGKCTALWACAGNTYPGSTCTFYTGWVPACQGVLGLCNPSGGGIYVCTGTTPGGVLCQGFYGGCKR